MTDNIFHGKVPSKMIIGMVGNAAYSGNYAKNPFNFENMNTNFLEVTVDGHPVPDVALRPDYSNNDYVSSYLTLLDNEMGRKKGLIIKLNEYPDGYTLYLLDIESFLSRKILSKSKSGHVRINASFASPLQETINVIVYAKFPEIISIDQSRNVIVQ